MRPRGAPRSARTSHPRGHRVRSATSSTDTDGAVDAVTFLIQSLNAVQYGLLLFLVASGLTLIFGAMGIINLAHGSFYMVGAYFAYALAPWVGSHLHGGFFTTLAVGLLLSVVLGYLLEWAFFSLLYEREHLQQV